MFYWLKFLYRFYTFKFSFLKQQMSRDMTKPTKWHVRPAMTPISLGIRPVWSVFAVRMKKPWVLSYPLSAQRRLWSDWADARLSLLWVNSHFVGFVMRWLKFKPVCQQKLHQITHNQEMLLTNKSNSSSLCLFRNLIGWGKSFTLDKLHEQESQNYFPSAGS